MFFAGKSKFVAENRLVAGENCAAVLVSGSCAQWGNMAVQAVAGQTVAASGLGPVAGFIEQRGEQALP